MGGVCRCINKKKDTFHSPSSSSSSLSLSFQRLFWDEVGNQVERHSQIQANLISMYKLRKFEIDFEMIGFHVCH
jgi:hypothetical protein